MKKGWLLVLAVLLPYAAAADITTQVDRFTGEVVIRSDISKISSWSRGPDVIWHATVKDHNVATVGVMLAFTQRDWKYLQCHSMHWLVDGAPLPTAEATHDGRVQRGGVVEFIDSRLTLPQVASFTTAQVVEFRVCNDVYRFTPAQIADMHEFGVQLAAQLKQP